MLQIIDEIGDLSTPKGKDESRAQLSAAYIRWGQAQRDHDEVAEAHRALPAALAEVRDAGLGTGLHTAGVSASRLSNLLPLLDWVGLDVKTHWPQYPGLTGVAGSGAAAKAALTLVLNAGIAYEVRTTAHPQWLPDQSLLHLQQELAAEGVKHFAVQLYQSTGAALADCPPAVAADYPSSLQQSHRFQTLLVRD